VGTLSPLHCTALGKILLAFADAPLPRKLTSFTSRTPVSRDALQAAIDGIVSVGYSVDDEEFATGIRCVAAPLRDAGGHVVAAIGVSGPTARIAARELDELGVLVKGVVEQFSLRQLAPG
jgi:DNA-binding IclR family transcriptional regulator